MLAVQSVTLRVVTLVAQWVYLKAVYLVEQMVDHLVD
jgi:hypothetical protein